MVITKRVYEKQDRRGPTYLVERLWPRGMRKDALRLDGWLRDVAPSPELRRWYSHDVSKWSQFRRRYVAELDRNPQAWQPLLQAAREGDVTLVYAARDTEHNSAIVLKDYLEQHLTATSGGRAQPAKAAAARRPAASAGTSARRSSAARARPRQQTRAAK